MSGKRYAKRDKVDLADPALAEHYRRKNQRSALFEDPRFRMLLSESTDITTACSACGRPMKVTAVAIAVGRLMSEESVRQGMGAITKKTVGFLCSAADYPTFFDPVTRCTIIDNCDGKKRGLGNISGVVESRPMEQMNFYTDKKTESTGER